MLWIWETSLARNRTTIPRSCTLWSSHYTDTVTAGNYTLKNLRSALLCDITERRVVILYRRFGTTYRSHLQGSRSPIRCSETSVKDCHSTLRNITEECRCHQHRGESLKSRIERIPEVCVMLKYRFWRS
jgi:hypothetical protein